MRPTRIVLATRNPGKLTELRDLLRGLPVELASAADLNAPEVEETEETLEGNALLKARALNELTGLPALADDTGLEVDALGGAPGVRSARYAGPAGDAVANRAKLLVDLADAAAEAAVERSARFRTVLAYVDGEDSYLFDGVCEGSIASEEAGAGGFGYDALFVPAGQPDGAAQTFAEMTLQQKQAISHRGRALQSFVAWMRGRHVAVGGR